MQNIQRPLQPKRIPSVLTQAEVAALLALLLYGTVTMSDTARVSCKSKPLFVPSQSMLMSKISPAPYLAEASRVTWGLAMAAELKLTSNHAISAE